MIRSPAATFPRTQASIRSGLPISSSPARARSGAPPCRGPENAPIAATTAETRSAPVEATTRAVNVDAAKPWSTVATRYCSIARASSASGTRPVTRWTHWAAAPRSGRGASGSCPDRSRCSAARSVGVLDLVMVVLADHDLAVSTVAARVAASARAHPYAVVSAGLGALDGPYHGTASILAHRFLGDALDDPVRALSERLRGGDPVPGFGHRIYRRRDPRADLVLALLRDRNAPVLAAVDAVAAGLAGRPDGFPNVDLALAAATHALDLRPDAG